jgi:peptide deformylase
VVIAVRRVLTYGDPLLRRKAVAVGSDLESLRPLVEDMFETMYAEPGIGLAAPQVGVSERLVVVAAVADDDAGSNLGPPLVLVDPEILWRSPDLVPFEEGCLSVPGITESVDRPRAIRFRFRTLANEAVEREAAGLLARVVQHEVDHLDGVLFVDRMRNPQTDLVLRSERDLAPAS